MSRGEARAGVATTARGACLEPDRSGTRTGCGHARPGRPTYAIEVVRVLARDGAEALIEIDGRQTSACLAIPPPVTVEPGDLLVVIGGVGRWWGVGMLGGLPIPADVAMPAFDTAAGLRMHAPNGGILLEAERTRIGGRTASIAAATLRATAHSCVLRCRTANQWIMGCLSQVVGGLVQVVTGDYRLRSRAIDARAEGTVSIKGSRVRLN